MFLDFFGQKPTKLKFLFDCSGSMYRFNSQDKRLERQAALAVMLMEALSGYEDRFDYEMVSFVFYLVYLRSSMFKIF